MKVFVYDGKEIVIFKNVKNITKYTFLEGTVQEIVEDPDNFTLFSGTVYDNINWKVENEDDSEIRYSPKYLGEERKG